MVQFTEATKVKTEVQDIVLSVIFVNIMLITKRSQHTPIFSDCGQSLMRECAGEALWEVPGLPFEDVDP